MKTNITKSLLVALACCSVGTAATAQTKGDGNIVEIFGRNRVETTKEGEVFHRFREGLLLPGGVGAGTLFNHQDMVGWLYAKGEFKTPKAGDKIGQEYPKVTTPTPPYMSNQEANSRRPRLAPLPSWEWSAIEADSAGKFNSPHIRTSYLYSSYNAPKEEVVLLETTGGTRSYFNGMIHEGDHYDFGYTLTPVKLRKGLNELITTPGRFTRVESKLVRPKKAIQLIDRDLTLPDIITGETDEKWGAIRLVNTTEKELKGMTFTVTLPTGEVATSPADRVMPMAVRKLKFKVPAARGAAPADGKLKASVVLTDAKGKEVDRAEITLDQTNINSFHERTFLSSTDGSVQYYSMSPAKENPASGDKALVLTVHGAGVEAQGQARSYAQKDWVNIAAATNRRPYGFNWEEWGRIDALEVFEDAKRVFNTDTTRSYLTGHSMGGHGTWYLGTTYPDKFAAIAPCASYPDIATYGSGRGDNMHRPSPMFEAFERGANAGRVVSMIHNLKQSGVYIHHGDADNVVPVSQVRAMREVLAKFHPNFCYYEYPGGEHWFGAASVDWQPIFEFFNRQSIPSNKDVHELDFTTASPAVSPKDYWVRVEQQQRPMEFSNVKASYEGDTVTIDTLDNVALLVLDLPSLEMKGSTATIVIDDLKLLAPSSAPAYLAHGENGWKLVQGVDKGQKYSARSGGFKHAFENNVVFVYATGGTKAENEWYQNKARFDAETFYYRGNGSNDVIADRDFRATDYPNRNVVIYGNSANNSAWASLLGKSPIQVTSDAITFGDKVLKGDDLGTYFIVPRVDSPTASVGVVAGTGAAGMRSTAPNNYVSGITGFPDVMIFRADVLRDGLEGMEAAGFLGNDWSVANGNMIVKSK